MKIKGWEYYNHAAIPSCAPHETPDLTPLEDKSIWKIDGGTPLLARWTTDFDCGYETNWWYIIRQAPYSINDVAPKERKRIRQSLNKCFVACVDMQENVQEIYNCYLSAFSRYENADNLKTYEQFVNACKKTMLI